MARRGHYRPFTLESGWLEPVGDVFGWTHLHKTSLVNSLITSGTTPSLRITSNFNYLTVNGGVIQINSLLNALTFFDEDIGVNLDNKSTYWKISSSAVVNFSTQEQVFYCSNVSIQLNYFFSFCFKGQKDCS